ncbi:flagellar basal body M-ring protein FliF [Alginatibacterium sediminis]|uniref:Flagellar M-ring protein n=1 Tax=Alginatibacterium sediminis TaxID=2164068 RepID=A0A420EFN8_9ALTE|nr:flagellar basal-body MS-ring/collar protein FliF [Alginatibacterium sediminis]RKF19480.1 flagellar basal body M-ring protein FliF [Alginatibacterium sediminis]
MANESNSILSDDNAILEDNLDANEQRSSGTLDILRNGDILRQVIMILALTIILGLGLFMFFWAKAPEMRPLATLNTEQLIETLDFLDQNKYEYKVDGKTVNVLSEQFNTIKLHLTRSGLSSSGSELAGEDILLKDMGFGVSQRLETERLKLSRERQLSEAIEAMQSVQRAKVLLAIPKTNVFAKREQQPSGTVVLTLRRNNGLPQEEIDSIVDIVASAVHGLVPSRVTVTDHHGRLLNSGSQDPISSRNRREFELERQREDEYKNKIDAILIPILGVGNYTAEVDVTMDFTAVEQTQKTFNPDLPAIRSELLVEDNKVGGGAIGIPGALTNQPPLDADIPEVADGGANARNANASNRSESTRNYELDTTISHTRSQTGTVQRVSVSVAVDHLPGADGAQGEPRSAEQILNIRRLLQGGVGFSINRGDNLEVVSVPFSRPDAFEVSDLPIWEQEWFWRAVRTAGAVLVLIVLILAVIRPILNKMWSSGETEEETTDLDAALAAYENDDEVDLLALDNSAVDFGIREGQLQLPDLHKDEDLLKAVRALVANEPDLAAMVIKDWVINDG